MIIANRAVHANGVICDLPIKNEVSGLALASIYRGVLTLYDCLRFVIEFRHELSRTNLCGLIRGIGDGDFDVRDADVFFVFAGIRGALNQAIPHDTARFGAILICFVVAIAFALVAVVCGRFTYKRMRAASRD